VTTTQPTIFVPLYSYDNFTMKMYARATETCCSNKCD